MVPDEFVRSAESLTDRVREVVRLASLEPEVEIKSNGTPVTTVDREVESELRRVIEREQPGHGIIGEEFGAEGTDRDWVWVLDPVDGTRQFAAGLPNFGTLITFCHEGRPVIGVISHLFYESTCIGVLKTTALASTVTMAEITGVPEIIVAETFAPYEVFLSAAVIYLILLWIFERCLAVVERTLDTP